MTWANKKLGVSLLGKRLFIIHSIVSQAQVAWWGTASKKLASRRRGMLSIPRIQVCNELAPVLREWWGAGLGPLCQQQQKPLNNPQTILNCGKNLL
jgi:hypothetical protein